MVHPLYAVGAFVCGLVALLIHFRVSDELDITETLSQKFTNLTSWVFAFTLIDGFWGLFAAHIFTNARMLFALSGAFHAGAAVTGWFWVEFVLSYLEINRRDKIIYRSAVLTVIAVQLVLLALNFKTGRVYYVDAQGFYCTGSVRQVLFYMQYSVYLLTAILCLANLTTKNEQLREDIRSVLGFTAAPIALGVFQLLYPDAPAYSIGYMLGILLIFTSVINHIIIAGVNRQAKAIAANEAKSSFLFNMSHDMRTPMNAILGYSRIARNHIDDDGRVLECLYKIESSGGQLLSIINDVLEMSRIESGKLEIQEYPSDISKCFEGLLPMVESMAIEKSIDFQFIPGTCQDKYLHADVVHLNRIIANLLTNAMKYTNQGGRVRFEYGQTGRDEKNRAVYQFVIKDTGIGMSEEFQQHLFEQFSREQTATVSRQAGTGLGLAIVKNIIDAVEGTIRVTSAPGEGSEFAVTIPFTVLNEEEEQEFFRQSEVVAENITPVILNGLHCLLVEDNEMNREITQELLESANLTVDTAEDGQIALDKFKAAAPGTYDFILMDIQMPVMNGFDATKAIRDMGGEGAEIPIVALSANAYEEDRQRSLESGMNEHVAKPIDVKQLFNILRAVMEARQKKS